MYWPNSPFEENQELLEHLRADYINSESIAELGYEFCDNRFKILTKYLCFPPSFTTVRLDISVEPSHAVDSVLQHIKKKGSAPHVAIHPILKDLLIIQSPSPFPNFDVVPRGKEVIVGLQCGEAVLRGAPVFAAGILGAPNGLCPGDVVSVFCDLDGKCLKGSKLSYCGRKVFVGNGMSHVSRDTLFKSSTPKGVAIEIIEPVCDCPPADLLQVGVLQNLPSVVCVHVLNPRPFQWVIDMCAAPGGKTTHIGCLMNDKGVLVALDKTSPRVAKLREAVSSSNLTCIRCFIFDATKCVDTNKMPTDAQAIRSVVGAGEQSDGLISPPFPPGLFDKVLLDAPCSGLGRRPQLANRMMVKELRCYPVLQKKLFKTAVNLLRIGGTLVYSTCTLTLGENEGLVKWALDEFQELELQEQVPFIGGPGMTGSHLTQSDRLKLQRFEASFQQDVSVNSDTNAFFIAKFVKRTRIS